MTPLKRKKTSNPKKKPSSPSVLPEKGCCGLCASRFPSTLTLEWRARKLKKIAQLLSSNNKKISLQHSTVLQNTSSKHPLLATKGFSAQQPQVLLWITRQANKSVSSNINPDHLHFWFPPKTKHRLLGLSWIPLVQRQQVPRVNLGSLEPGFVGACKESCSVCHILGLWLSPRPGTLRLKGRRFHPHTNQMEGLLLPPARCWEEIMQEPFICSLAEGR